MQIKIDWFKLDGEYHSSLAFDHTVNVDTRSILLEILFSTMSILDFSVIEMTEYISVVTTETSHYLFFPKDILTFNLGILHGRTNTSTVH